MTMLKGRMGEWGSGRKGECSPLSPLPPFPFSLILILTLLGCQPGADAPTTVTFWSMGVEAEYVEAMMPDFERAHPGIRVDVQQIPWNSAYEKLLSAYAGEATPDLCQLGNTWIPAFAAMNALEPLDAWLAESDAIDRGDYFDGIWATNVIDSTTFGLLWYVDTRLLFYRTDLLQEAGFDSVPATWAGWRDAMEAIQAQADPGSHAAFMPLNEFFPATILGLQTGSDLLREGPYGDFQGEAFRRAFDFYIDLFDDGLTPALSGSEVGNLYQEFARGRFAMYITGPWNIGEFRRRLPDSLQTRWMTAPLPGPDGPGVSIAGGASLVLFRGTEHKEAAWTLMEWLSQPEQQVRFYADAGNLPPRRTAWADSILATNVYARAFQQQLERTVPAPVVPEWERIAAKIMEYAEFAARGAMTRDEALAALDRDVDRILEKRRWVLAQTD